MTFLPIVERELRVAARRRGTYSARTVSALAAIALCAWMLIALGQFAGAPAFAPLAQGGAQLFRALSWLAFFYALIAGVRLTSDCLSEEKREGTLGLLFLTDLKGYDVVLGKLAASSLNGAYGFLAMMPVLAVPILMGGVTAGDFWRMVFVLADTLFLSLATGIFVSCVSRVERKAMGGTILLLLVMTSVMPFLAAPMRPGVGVLFFWASPWVCFNLAFGGRLFAPGSADFWYSLLVIHAFGWTFLGLASWLTPHVWKDKPGSRRVADWRQRWHNLLYGSAEQRLTLRRRLLGINPLYWLASRERLARSYPWIFLGAMVLIWVWGFAQMPSDWLGYTVTGLASYLMHVVFKYWLATLACYAFAADRDKGALELLLSTRLTVKEMLRGQWLALWRLLGWPVLVVLFIDCVLLCAALGRPRARWEEGDKVLWGFFMLGNIVMFLLDLLTLGWVGMWVSVNSKGAHHAVSRTVMRVLIQPWIIVGLCLFLFGIAWGWDRFAQSVVLAVWVCAGLCTDALFGPWAYVKLHDELRRVAAQRYAAGRENKPWWRVALSG